MNVRHSIIGVSELLEWAESRGMNTQALLDNTQINTAMLQDPHATLLPAQELQFYKNLSTQSNDPLIAYNAGYQLNAGAHGMWGLALMSSETFEAAIRSGLRYLEFCYTYHQIELEVGPCQSALHLDPELSDPFLTEFMIERDVGAVHRLFVDLLQKTNPIVEIHLKAKALAHKKPLEHALESTVKLGTKKNSIVFESKYLQTALPQANQLTKKMCYQHLDALKPERLVITTTTQRVISYLSNHSIEQAKLASVSSYLNLSERSLRRKLSDEGTSFQHLVNDYKRVLAKDFLENTELTMEDIAEKLGYSDSAGFSNAYKRWYGVAPSFHSKME